MTKTFNIGEYCVYGTVRVTTRELKFKVELMDFRTKNVREKETFHCVDKHKIQMYLEKFTTCYYADKIINHFYA